MIKLENVSKKFPIGVFALTDVSFEVAKGEFVFLVGPTGSGKTIIGQIALYYDSNQCQYNYYKILIIMRALSNEKYRELISLFGSNHNHNHDNDNSKSCYNRFVGYGNGFLCIFKTYRC